MKSNYWIASIIVLVMVIASCRKDTFKIYNTSSITVVNSVENASDIVVDFSDTALAYYLNQAPIAYASSIEYGIPSGTTPVVVVASSDTAQTLTTMSLNLKAAGIYSLYLAGSSVAQIPFDAILLQDTIPVYADSMAGVRFINLSPGSNPVTINLLGNPVSQTEFPVLSYKQITTFKNYPDTNGISSYTFEIRDQATGNLLTTFSWGFTLFKSNTLVISGSEDPSSITPIGVFQVNNF